MLLRASVPVRGHTWCSKLIDYSFLFSIYLLSLLRWLHLFTSLVSLPLRLCQGQVTIKKPQTLSKLFKEDKDNHIIVVLDQRNCIEGG